MSTNRTSIPDNNLNTSHRFIHDELGKQQSAQQQQQQQQPPPPPPPHNLQYQTNANSKRPKQMDRSPDDDCDIIGQLIGKYGRYQFLMTFLLSLFQIPNTFHISSPIYQVCGKGFFRPSQAHDRCSWYFRCSQLFLISPTLTTSPHFIFSLATFPHFFHAHRVRTKHSGASGRHPCNTSSQTTGEM